MKLKHHVRINVAGPNSPEERLLDSVQATLRSRLLSKLVGDKYAVLVITPVSRGVRSVEIRELPAASG